jgi:beta-glucosidase
VERARAGTTGLAFFGDSITQGMDYAADTIMELWGKHHPNNFGIGGDTVQNLLWRLQNGELDGLKPKVAVVLIGTNNLSSDTDEDIAAGVKADAYELRRRCPKTRVVVLGILPRGQHASDKYRERIKQINQQLATVQDNRHIFFVDIGQSLLQPDGSISPEVMPDFLHPNAQGYKLMFHALKPHIDPLLEDKADQRRKTSSNSSRERLSTSSPPPRE